MQNRNRYYILLLWIGLILSATSCSTQKNTAASRSFHATTTRYNIYFNGAISFDEGLRAIDEANQDNFSQVIPLYPVSNHTAAESAASQMDRTIEKCRKCIKLHSIKAKPKINQKKRSDPKYQAFLNQREFNKYMWEAWILLGKAEFHKGDFLGSVGTFNYVARQYDYDKNIVAICQLWSVRAYAEMGWLYEAEELLQKVSIDDLSRKHAWLYSAVSADLKLKTDRYKDAVPFLKLALKEEARAEKLRYTYVLAQLYELQGDKKTAISYYKKVGSLNPSAEMDFSARLKRLQLSGDLKALGKMAEQYKYRDRLDQIYGAIGDIYISRQDTVHAIEHYQLAIDKSTQGGLPKAKVLVQAGDIYYQLRDYNHAQPCYKEAVTILSADNTDYKRIQNRAETLDELVVEYNTVQLQDSLQRLSKLSPEEQLRIVENIIAELERAEKEAAEKQAQAARDAENGGLQSVNTLNMVGGGGGSADWYFYNAQLMRSGKQAFIQRWGTRPLEDNWRRISKTIIAPAYTNDSDDLPLDSLGNDSTKPTLPVSDNKDPQFYLQQIPKTEADFALSDSLIASALYKMIYIYQDKINDAALAQETYEEFCRRFPADQRLVDLYYMFYLNSLKQNNTAFAEVYRQKIISGFPDSKQALIVSQPDYFSRLQKMVQEQESLYADTYRHYRTARFDSVKYNTRYAEQNYQLSPLMPKFLFLNAIAVAKTEGQDAFVACLRDMVARYPQSETSAMAKDMLAVMNQGMESQMGGSASTLLERRDFIEQDNDTTQEYAFSSEKTDKSTVCIAFNTKVAATVFPNNEEEALNQLLYQVALFNFSQFLIKDFDLRKVPMFGMGTQALEVSGFDNYDEALWYISLLQSNEDVHMLLQQLQADLIPITDTNKSLLNTRFSVEDYKAFQKTLK